MYSPSMIVALLCTEQSTVPGNPLLYQSAYILLRTLIREFIFTISGNRKLCTPQMQIFFGFEDGKALVNTKKKLTGKLLGLVQVNIANVQPIYYEMEGEVTYRTSNNAHYILKGH